MLRLTLATFLTVLSAAAPALAQETAGGLLDAAVAPIVAEAWGVAEDAVVLQWGAFTGDPPSTEAAASLRGSGSGGNWVVRFEEPDGEVTTVRLRAGHVARRPTAARRIDRGTELGPADVAMAEQLVWGPPRQAAPDPEGWVAQRAIDAGEVLRAPSVRPPLLVTSGSPVALVWERGVVRIRVVGRAAGSGGLGDRIRVRTDAGRRLVGVVIDRGVVDVTASSQAIGGSR